VAPPTWTTGTSASYDARARPEVREQYAAASALVAAELPS
jgi:hypothetical protein